MEKRVLEKNRDLLALAQEADRRHLTYGRFIRETTPEERWEIIGRARRRGRRKKKVPPADCTVTLSQPAADSPLMIRGPGAAGPQGRGSRKKRVVLP